MQGDSGRADLPAFEEIYARAGDALASVPWARLAPHPLLVMWLDSAGVCASRPSAVGGEALVVGCGLGDDAEELARRGYAVTAFDVSPTAIARCRERFPRSPVCYRDADVLNPPGEWRGRFGLVVEINTIQSLPRDRLAAIAAIAGTVARGGLLFVRCLAGGEDEPDGPERPWPVRRSELDGFTAAGLTQVDLIDHAPVPAAFPFLRGIYQRSSPLRSATSARRRRAREDRNKRAQRRVFALVVGGMTSSGPAGRRWRHDRARRSVSLSFARIGSPDGAALVNGGMPGNAVAWSGGAGDFYRRGWGGGGGAWVMPLKGGFGVVPALN